MTQQLHKNDILYYARIMPTLGYMMYTSLKFVLLMKKTDGSVAWKNVLK